MGGRNVAADDVIVCPCIWRADAPVMAEVALAAGAVATAAIEVVGRIRSREYSTVLRYGTKIIIPVG